MRAILGLFVLNGLILVIGSAVLWALRGWRWWTELGRLLGLAYLLGLAALMIGFTLELVVGIPFNTATICATGLAIAGGGVLVGRVLKRPRPFLRSPDWQFPGVSIWTSLFVAAVVVYFEAMFRAGRLAPITEDADGWGFWIPKAKSLHFFGGMEPSVVAALGGYASYPLGMPIVDALAFRSMGSVDVATLHLQYWFLAVAFVAAIVGVLAARVQLEIVLPVLVVMLVMPSFVLRSLKTYSDIPLGYVVALAAVLILLWLEERRSWQLASATVFLSSAMLIKREGALFVACLILAAAAASWRVRREIWPRLLVSLGAAVVLALPWRLWILTQDVPGDGPEAGYSGSLLHTDRILPAFELTVETLFDHELWLVIPPVAVVATSLVAVVGEWKHAAFAATFLLTSIAAVAWAIWSNPALPFTQVDSVNPVVRLVGSTVLVLAALVPLLFRHAISSVSDGVGILGRLGAPRRLPWALVAAVVLVYPTSMFVGYSGKTLPGGWPSFPDANDCRSALDEGAKVRVVLGRASSYPSALSLRRRALDAGIERPATIQHDGCGFLRVSIGPVESLRDARTLASEAAGAGFDARVESIP